MSRTSLAAAAVALIAGSAIVAPPPAAYAQIVIVPDDTLIVTRYDDPPSNGCNIGDCSLREAIIHANGSITDYTIQLDTGTYTLTRAGDNENAALTGDLDITNNMLIVGDGPSETFIDGNGIDRVFEIRSSGATVEIRDLAIVGGETTIGTWGGGVANTGTLTLTDVVVQGNRAAALGWGGGIHNFGTMTLNDVIVRSNRAGSGRPATSDLGGYGGGIMNDGTLSMFGGSIDHNFAGAGGTAGPGSGEDGGSGGGGGGIWNTGTAIITGTTIEVNQAGRGGDGASADPVVGVGGKGGPGGNAGGIGNSGELEISSSTIARNEAGHGGSGGAGTVVNGAAGGTGGDGGGIRQTSGTMEISSTTIADNEAGDGGHGGDGSSVVGVAGAGGDGGGIFMTGTLVAHATTISGNRAGSGGVEGTGGGLLVKAGSATLTNVTISGNDGHGLYNDGTLTARFTTLADNGDFFFGGSTSIGSSIIGDAGFLPGFTSAGYNVFGLGLLGGHPTDITMDAVLDLGPLAANSSPETHALGAHSDAIDLVPISECSESTDARGMARPYGPGCDAGAFERHAPPAPDTGDTVGLVDVTTGTWHLRNATGAVTSFVYGNPVDLPIAGDWDGDGIATPGLYRQSDGFFYARDSNTTGVADNECFAGNPEDIPIVGDWDGDGDDNLGIYRPSQQTFYLFTTTCTGSPMGAAQISFLFGNPGDTPVSGDWDADGITEIGLHRQTTGFFYWRNTLDTGVATDEIFFGDPADRFITGDWGTIDGIDTPAIYRPTDVTFYFRHTLTEGIADGTIPWPGAGTAWLPVSGTFGLD